MLARFWDYLPSVIAYWQFWVAVAFSVECAAERFFPMIWQWAEPTLTPELRRRVFVWIAIIAFVYANFRAFDRERSLREEIVGAPNKIAALETQVHELSRELSQFRWIPLTDDEIVAIKHAVAETRPAQPAMHIQYLDANAYNFALSLKRLFAEIGFNPIMQLDTRLSLVGMTVFDADDRDAELVRKIINAIETVTKDRVKCELRVSKGQGQTTIFIGQKDASQ